MNRVLRTISLLGLLAVGGPLQTACQAGEQPEQCELFLTCFYPEDPMQSPDYLDDRPQNDQLAEDAEAAFGQDGECWKHGSQDRFYEICLDTCVEVIAEECRRFADGEARPCVRSEGGAMVFDPPDWDGEAYSCAEAIEAATSEGE